MHTSRNVNYTPPWRQRQRPATFASDKDRLARFEREAKLLAALNHPHIAEALEFAQDRGVMHRDLKPATIMGPSDIWIADKDRDGDGYADNVWRFASLTDPDAEGTGIYFGKDPKTMFVYVQHSVLDDGDATWAITKR